MAVTNCRLCPRACGADRTRERGFCGGGEEFLLARAAPYFGEEPCLSGTRGVGALFFAGCTLQCVYCQNEAISRGGAGEPIGEERLCEILFALKAQGVHAIELVTADHETARLAPLLASVKPALGLPIVLNCSGYETPAMLHAWQGIVDVFLPDFKYADPLVAQKLSCAADYPAVALRALRIMAGMTGRPVFDADGILRRGTLVRHLVLPGYRKNSLDAIALLRANFAPDAILVSLMGQYTPHGAPPAPGRRLTRFEYDSVKKVLLATGFEGYVQELSSAGDDFLPAFDGEGLHPAKV